MPDSPDSEVPVSTDDETATTTLIQVQPGLVAAWGEVPTELGLDSVDLGLMPGVDRDRIATVLAGVGDAISVGGDTATALASCQGLYRMTSASQKILQGGAALAVKNGENLGAMMANGRIVAQARFLPMVMQPAALAAGIGPALAMVAMQVQLSQITGLIKDSIDLTGQVLQQIRAGQWAELEGLVDALDGITAEAHESEAVAILWGKAAVHEPAVLKQCKLYKGFVAAHAKQLAERDAHGRRAYLDTNAEAILFDANALLLAIKAWAQYQSLYYAKVRADGQTNPTAERLAQRIARESPALFDQAVAEATMMIDSLARELWLVAELPGAFRFPIGGKANDAKASRRAAKRLYEAIRPLAEALHPELPPLAVDVTCLPEGVKLDACLSILRWFVDRDESLRAIAFADQPDGPPVLGAIAGAFGGLAAAVKHDQQTKTMIAVTDRRILTADTSTFLREGELQPDIAIDQVRYVRMRPADADHDRAVVDLITQDENVRWFFPADEVDVAQVKAFAGVLAQFMAIPEEERAALVSSARCALESGVAAEVAQG